jgi:tetratricopeptide (TPR) repeat protein
MRFAFRTLVPVSAATVVLSVSTAFLSRPVAAEDAAKKSSTAAPAKDTIPAAAAGATPGLDTTAPAADAVDPAPLLAKGEAALKANDFGAAMAAFNEAGKAAQQAGQQGGTESLKAQIAAFVGRGRAEVGLKDYEAAEKDFRNVLQSIDPNDVSALVALGQLKFDTGHIDDALDQFQNAVKADPTSGPALLGYGKSLVQFGRGDEAISSLTRAIAIDPKNAEAYRFRGAGNAAVFKNKQAVEDIQKSIELNPDDYESYFTLGMLDVRGEDYKGAVDQIGKAIEHYKPKPGMEDRPYLEGYLQLASAYIELGKAATKDSPEQKAAYQASLDEVQKLIKQLDEKNPMQKGWLAAALFSRGVAERMLGQLGAAVRTFSHAIELRMALSPDDSTSKFLTDAYYRRGICFHLIGEDKMAISDFETAAHLDSTDPRANLWEGFTYAKLGDYQQALRAYGDAIAASDRFTPAYYNRGLAYLMMGNYKKAVSDLNDAIRLEPANAQYYFVRGVAYQEMGDHQKASESYSAAIEFDKTHSAAHRHMIEVLEKMGRKELAEQYRVKFNQLTAPKDASKPESK